MPANDANRVTPRRPTPSAVLDERRTLLMFGWIVGSLLFVCLALSAMALSYETGGFH